MDEPQVDPSLRDRREMGAPALGDCHRHDGLPGVAVLSILRFCHQDRGERRRMDEPQVDPLLRDRLEMGAPALGDFIAMTDYPA